MGITLQRTFSNANCNMNRNSPRTGHKSPVHLTNGTSGHLDTAFNEFDLAFKSEVHLHGVDKLRPPNTDAYNQHCNDADKNSTSLI